MHASLSQAMHRVSCVDSKRIIAPAEAASQSRLDRRKEWEAKICALKAMYSC
jgi:hypothetical protein